MTEEMQTMELPQIHRARDYYLYDYKGNRYLDLYLAGGGAIMGHRPGKISRELKNGFSRGLYASYPAVYTKRLQRALLTLFPWVSDFRVYRNRERAIGVISKWTGREVEPEDPVYNSSDQNFISYWRPFLHPPAFESDKGRPRPGLVLPLFPFPGDFIPAIICISKEFAGDLPPSDLVSPALIFAVIKTIYNLLEFRDYYGEDKWKCFPLPFWDRKGPYLLFSGKAGEYPEIFALLKNRGILISPGLTEPSIVPGAWTEGEVSFLRKL